MTCDAAHVPVHSAQREVLSVNESVEIREGLALAMAVGAGSGQPSVVGVSVASRAFCRHAKKASFAFAQGESVGQLVASRTCELVMSASQAVGRAAVHVSAARGESG